MQKVTLLAVGSIKTPWIQAGCDEYGNRLRRSCNFDVIEVPASKQKDPAKQQEEESLALIDRLEKFDGQVWVLDETGHEMTSESFSKEMSMLNDQGVPITFVLGGAYGLTEVSRQKADKIIALSKMTFPHELCRLVFLEQLYRASEIQKGSGYHH